MRGKKPWSHWDGITAASERDQADPRRAAARRAPLLAVGAAEVRDLPVPVPARRDLPDAAGRGSRAAAAHGSADARQPVPRGADRVLPPAAGRGRAAGDAGRSSSTRSPCSTTSIKDDRRAQQYELLAPAIDRVWHDEIGAIRRDLRLWVDEIARADGEWVPRRFEWAFGYSGRRRARRRARSDEPARAGRDRRPLPPARLDRPGRGARRHRRAARHRSQDREVSRQGPHDRRRRPGAAAGAVLARARSRRLERPVVEGRLYYATTAGGYRDVRIPLTPQARRMGIEVLEIIDRAIETGFLAPAPARRRARGATSGRCAGRRRSGASAAKAHEPLADLLELRRKP